MAVAKEKPEIESLDSGSAFKCWPSIRNEYRKHAYDAYCDGDTDRAILYDSKSLSCGFVGTEVHFEEHAKFIHDQDINSTIQLQKNSVNPLVDYLSEYLNDNDVVTTQPSSKENGITNEQQQLKHLYVQCDKLPAEWNVIQVTQMYDGYNGYATKRDMYNGNGPMVLTLFRYNLMDKRDNRALSLVPDANELSPKNIFQTAFEVNQILYKNYSLRMNSPDFNSFIKHLTQTQSKLVTDMKLWLGPWITLFSGKVKGKTGVEYEQKIYDEVEKLCKDFDDFPDDDLVLLSLVARRIDLLDAANIKQAAHHFARSALEFNRLVEWMAQLKSKRAKNEFQYYPCILVLDELVDYMPWEMVLPAQEFSRMHSIYMLLDLHERFKDQIRDGYFQVNVKNGFAMINPDNDEKLQDMHKRISQFYTKNLPNWKRFELTAPNIEDIADCLSNNDLFVYSGHGSSLQFFNTEAELNDLKHRCLILLFGCESIAMRPRGTICEATSSSYTFYKSGCPGVLGALTIVTDIWVDLITILIITQWITSRKNQHPVIDVCKDAVSKERVNKILAKRDGQRNPNLLALLSDIRLEQDLSIRMRSAMVYRGLPPHNTALAN